MDGIRTPFVKQLNNLIGLKADAHNDLNADCAD